MGGLTFCAGHLAVRLVRGRGDLCNAKTTGGRQAGTRAKPNQCEVSECRSRVSWCSYCSVPLCGGVVRGTEDASSWMDVWLWASRACPFIIHRT
eukprot:881622-Prymnesium_polylepis.2